MIKQRFFLVACFACLLPFSAFSEAPVVDDSENYALLDEQQAAFESPVVKTQGRDYGNDEETALANDNLETATTKRQQCIPIGQSPGLAASHSRIARSTGSSSP